MAKAKKLPSGNWNVLVYAGTDSNGKRKYESFTAESKKEAEFLAAEFALKRKELRDPKNLTVQEAIKRYVDSKDGVLSPSTIRGYRTIQNNNLQALWNVRLSALTNETIQLALTQEATTHSPKSVSNMCGLLTAALKMFAPGFVVRVSLPRKKERRSTVPVDAQIKQLLELARGTEIELPIILAAMGSLRAGEIAALTQEDVESGGVRVSKAIVRNQHQQWEVKQSPKTQAGIRLAPLPEPALELLRKRCEGKSPSDRLFEFSPQTIYKRYAALRVQCGMEQCRFHDLRHYYASMAHALGIPDQYIMQNGGWKDKGTLTRIYQHAQDDRAQMENKKLTGFFSEFLK